MVFNKLALAIASSAAFLLSGCITDPDPDPVAPVIVQNEAPVIDSVGVLNGVYTIAARDNEGDALAYSWEINNISHGTSAEFTPDIDGLSGLNIVTVVVTDSAGNKAFKIVEMDFGNLAPTMSVSDPDGGIYTINAEDPENDNLEFTWEIAGVVRGDSVSFDPSLIDLDGQIEVVASVIDSAGNKVTETIGMTFIKFNLAPVVTITDLDGVLTVTATDPEGEVLTYSWHMGADSLSVTDTFDT